MNGELQGASLIQLSINSFASFPACPTMVSLSCPRSLQITTRSKGNSMLYSRWKIRLSMNPITSNLSQWPCKIIILRILRSHVLTIPVSRTLNDPESIRKACSRYCTLYGYEDSLVLSWLYRELKNFAATGDKSIVEYMFENIFKKSLTEKYCK